MVEKSNFGAHTSLALAAAVGLSACAPSELPKGSDGLDTASRAAPVEPTISTPTDVSGDAPNAFLGDFNVVAVTVNVPKTLVVSEANRYLPNGDIVWREDPPGDRHDQVRAIFAAAMEDGIAELDGSKDVILDVAVTRFHALTEKARYSVGGVHALQFSIRLRDAASGDVIAEPKFIKADFEAFGGQEALAAEAKGLTQKVRITQHLAAVIREELGDPDGFTPRQNGLIGALNQKM